MEQNMEHGYKILPWQFRFKDHTLKLKTFYSRVVDVIKETKRWVCCVYLNLEKSMWYNAFLKDFLGNWKLLEERIRSD